jgi:hypothetical protein
MENAGLVFGIAFDRLLVGALQMRDQLEYFWTQSIGANLDHTIDSRNTLFFVG